MKMPQFDPNTVLEKVGLTTRPEYSTSVLSALALFGTGLLVGASVALLLTPKSGRELRSDVSRSANRVGNQVRRALPSTSASSRRTDPLMDNGSHPLDELESDLTPQR
ncbi:MAG: YtxH domain-containing protein [Myxococcota bacterium]